MVKPMDRLDERLREDARRIEADVGPNLRERIRASLESTRPEKELPRRKGPPGTSLWWASSLTGLAAALVVIAVINSNRGGEPVEETSSPPAPDITWLMQSDLTLNAETAEWTTPLEEELKNLQSDLKKARESVERDLRLSF